MNLFISLVSLSFIFNSCTLSASAEEDFISPYPSYIEEYDELYFLENSYMEALYNRYYYNMDKEFQRIDLTDNEFAQEFRSEIESAYVSKTEDKLSITLTHTTEYSFREYVDIIFNTYIEFIKYHQYQESTIQPDFSTCSFKPYVSTSSTTNNEYYTDIVIYYTSYE